MTPPQRIAFGEFVLDRRRHLLLHRTSTEPVVLTPKLYDALVLFVEHAGELLDKDRLLATLWPDLVVEENNLSQVVSGLRRALGDDAQGSRYIQTVPRRGFRFVATVNAVDPAPASAENTPSGVGAPTRRWLVAAGFGAAAVVAAGWWWRQPRGLDPVAARPTLAVLPFKPLIAEGRDELLEIGMADSLIARLSTVPGLVVRSVGSVRRFAGADQDPLAAARALDVTWIVDGSLQRRGTQLRASARLLSAADGLAAWSGSFDQTDADVFALQDQISLRVASALAPWLGAPAAGQPQRGAVGGTRSADAYELYLAGRQHAQGLRAAGLRQSAELLRKAIAADPEYALAHAALVETYRRMIFGADAAPAEVLVPAQAAAQRALALAPTLAEAHAGLAWVRFWYDFDWPGAERLFRHALTLNPNIVEAHFGLGLLLLSMDRPAEGLAHLTSARQLDPLSLILNALEAGYLLAQQRRPEADARLARAFEIDPDFWVAHLTQAGFHLADGQREAALQALRRADALADGSTQATALLGMLLARMGRNDEARTVLQRLRALELQRYVPPTSIAAVLAALGETGLALDALERAYALRDTRLVYMKDDGRWAALRREPRYAALLQRMRLDGVGPGRPAN